MPRMGESFKAALVFAVIFALCGLLAATSLGGGEPTPEEARVEYRAPAVAGGSGFLISLVLWRAIVARARAWRIARGVVSGVASGVLVHPAGWALESGARSLMLVLGMSSAPLGEPPLSPGHEIVAVFKFSIVSLLFFGWLTVLVGALTGGLLAIWASGATDSPGAQDTREPGSRDD